jgi:DNA-binding cell septation regulator SpoVG
MCRLEITEITIHPSTARDAADPFLAMAKIVLNDAFAVNGIRIVSGESGPFVAFPREFKRGGDRSKHITVCHPIRKDLHLEMTQIILAEYETTMRAEARRADQAARMRIEKGAGGA